MYEDGEASPYCWVGQTSPGSAWACVPRAYALVFSSTQPEDSSTPAAFIVNPPGSSQGQYFTAESPFTQPNHGGSSVGPLVFDVESVTALGPNANPQSSSSLNGRPGMSWYETDIYYIASDGTVTAEWKNLNAQTIGPVQFFVSGLAASPPTTIYASYKPSSATISSMDPILLTLKAITS